MSWTQITFNMYSWAVQTASSQRILQHQIYLDFMSILINEGLVSIDCILPIKGMGIEPESVFIDLKRRAVPAKLGLDLATSLKMQYLECSAKDQKWKQDSWVLTLFNPKIFWFAGEKLDFLAEYSPMLMHGFWSESEDVLLKWLLCYF